MNIYKLYDTESDLMCTYYSTQEEAVSDARRDVKPLVNARIEELELDGPSEVVDILNGIDPDIMNTWSFDKKGDLYEFNGEEL